MRAGASCDYQTDSEYCVKQPGHTGSHELRFKLFSNREIEIRHRAQELARQICDHRGPETVAQQVERAMELICAELAAEREVCAKFVGDHLRSQLDGHFAVLASETEEAIRSRGDKKEMSDHKEKPHGPVSASFMQSHYGPSGYVKPLEQARPNRIREAAYILADQLEKNGWLKKEPSEYSAPDMICNAFYPIVKELIADTLKQDKKFTYCAYCAFTVPVDVDGSIIAEHVRTCEKHPARQWEAAAEGAAYAEFKKKALAIADDVYNDRLTGSLEEAFALMDAPKPGALARVIADTEAKAYRECATDLREDDESHHAAKFEGWAVATEARERIAELERKL